MSGSTPKEFSCQRVHIQPRLSR